mmetsp:Transcript_2906/g.4505  ORF Transcript_2906/g.4505 Transcript_2906/m.4505 type:complete len:253 (-) Transcript_2906:1159-1917(-)
MTRMHPNLSSTSSPTPPSADPIVSAAPPTLHNQHSDHSSNINTATAVASAKIRARTLSSSTRSTTRRKAASSWWTPRHARHRAASASLRLELAVAVLTNSVFVNSMPAVEMKRVDSLVVDTINRRGLDVAQTLDVAVETAVDGKTAWIVRHPCLSVLTGSVWMSLILPSLPRIFLQLSKLLPLRRKICFGAVSSTNTMISTTVSRRVVLCHLSGSKTGTSTLSPRLMTLLLRNLPLMELVMSLLLMPFLHIS